MKKYIFIKAGGSGNIIRNSQHSTEFSWLFYRDICINTSYFQTLINEICKVSKQYKIGLAVGGVGTYLFTDFAKNLELNSSLVNEIGIQVTYTTSYILLQKFIELKANVFPKLVENYENLEMIFSQYDLVLLKGSPEYLTTDSLIAYTASNFLNPLLIYFKTSVRKRILINNQGSLLVLSCVN